MWKSVNNYENRFGHGVIVLGDRYCAKFYDFYEQFLLVHVELVRTRHFLRRQVLSSFRGSKN